METLNLNSDFLKIFINLVALDLSCSTQDLRSLLQHIGSLVVAYEHLVAACRI